MNTVCVGSESMPVAASIVLGYAGVGEASGYARAVRAEPFGHRIDIDAVETVEQEQRARQRGKLLDRGAAVAVVEAAHGVTSAAIASRQNLSARII